MHVVVLPAAVGRLNSDSTKTLRLDVGGHSFLVHQDPTTRDLGTTLWDAGLLLARYLSKEVSSSFEGRRVLELGAGVGLPGLYCGLRGADVVMTDRQEVLPYMRKNLVSLVGSLGQSSSLGASAFNEVKVHIQEYLWGTCPLAAGLDPPYSMVLAADCIYDISALEPFLSSLLAVTDSKSVVYIANETRDEGVTKSFLEALEQSGFRVKKTPRNKMDRLPGSHPLIDIFVCRRRRGSNPPPTPPSAAATCSDL